MLPDEQAGPEQIAILRRMTPEQRWEAAHQLYWTMRRHKTAYLRSLHPEWSEEQLADEVRRNFSKVPPQDWAANLEAMAQSKQVGE